MTMDKIWARPALGTIVDRFPLAGVYSHRLAGLGWCKSRKKPRPVTEIPLRLRLGV